MESEKTCRFCEIVDSGNSRYSYDRERRSFDKFSLAHTCIRAIANTRALQTLDQLQSLPVVLLEDVKDYLRPDGLFNLSILPFGNGSVTRADWMIHLNREMGSTALDECEDWICPQIGDSSRRVAIVTPREVLIARRCKLMIKLVMSMVRRKPSKGRRPDIQICERCMTQLSSYVKSLTALDLTGAQLCWIMNTHNRVSNALKPAIACLADLHVTDIAKKDFAAVSGCLQTLLRSAKCSGRLFTLFPTSKLKSLTLQFNRVQNISTISAMLPLLEAVTATAEKRKDVESGEDEERREDVKPHSEIERTMNFPKNVLFDTLYTDALRDIRSKMVALDQSGRMLLKHQQQQQQQQQYPQPQQHYHQQQLLQPQQTQQAPKQQQLLQPQQTQQAPKQQQLQQPQQTQQAPKQQQLLQPQQTPKQQQLQQPQQTPKQQQLQQPQQTQQAPKQQQLQQPQQTPRQQQLQQPQQPQQTPKQQQLQQPQQTPRQQQLQQPQQTPRQQQLQQPQQTPRQQQLQQLQQHRPQQLEYQIQQVNKQPQQEQEQLRQDNSLQGLHVYLSQGPDDGKLQFPHHTNWTNLTRLSLENLEDKCYNTVLAMVGCRRLTHLKLGYSGESNQLIRLLLAVLSENYRCRDDVSQPMEYLGLHNIVQVSPNILRFDAVHTYDVNAVRNLELQNVKLDDLGSENFLRFLRHNTALTNLELGDLQTCLHLGTVLAVVSKHSSLETLIVHNDNAPVEENGERQAILSGRLVGDESVVVTFLKNTPRLKHLVLRRIWRRETFGTVPCTFPGNKLIRAVKRHASLQHLSLAHNPLDLFGVRLLRVVFEPFAAPSLKALRLEHCSLPIYEILWASKDIAAHLTNHNPTKKLGYLNLSNETTYAHGLPSPQYLKTRKTIVNNFETVVDHFFI